MKKYIILSLLALTIAGPGAYAMEEEETTLTLKQIGDVLGKQAEVKAKEFSLAAKARLSELSTVVYNKTDRMIFVAWKGFISRKGSYDRVEPGKNKRFYHTGDTIQVEIPASKSANGYTTRLKQDVSKLGRGYKNVEISGTEGNYSIKTS